MSFKSEARNPKSEINSNFENLNIKYCFGFRASNFDIDFNNKIRWYGNF